MKNNIIAKKYAAIGAAVALVVIFAISQLNSTKSKSVRGGIKPYDEPISQTPDKPDKAGAREFVKKITDDLEFSYNLRGRLPFDGAASARIEVTKNNITLNFDNSNYQAIFDFSKFVIRPNGVNVIALKNQQKIRLFKNYQEITVIPTHILVSFDKGATLNGRPIPLMKSINVLFENIQNGSQYQAQFKNW
jgi:hypothetical protein